LSEARRGVTQLKLYLRYNAQQGDLSLSQGFCCSCEGVAAPDAGSSPSSFTKLRHYQQDGANRARNRSESSANLFDDSEAQRQITANENEERSRGGAKSGDARERVTSRNISVVNGPLGAEELPFRKQEKRLRNYSLRHSSRPSEEILIEDRNSMRTSSPMLKNIVFYDAMPSNGKIEAFIDTVYEHTKERNMKQQDNKRNEDSLYDRNRAGKPRDATKSQESDSRINSDRYPIYGSAEDYFRNANTRLSAGGDYNISKSESRTSSPQFFGRRSSDRYLIHELAANDLQNANMELIKNERDFARAKENNEDNRKLLEPGKSCDRLENFSERGNREGKPKDRSCSAIRLGNAFDYTPTALLPVRIPEGSQFSRRTQENALAMHGDNALPDNKSLATTVEFFASSRMPFRSSINYINYAVTPAMELNGFAKDMIALLSNMVIPKTHLSTRKGDQLSDYRVSSNVNASRNAPIEWRNLNAAAIPSDNMAGEKRKTENVNVSRISNVPAFARLRNLSSLAGISRLEELPAATAPSTDKSSIGEILKPRTRDSSLSHEIQRFPGFGDLHENREWCRICNSSSQAPRDMSLKDGYRFRKAYQKLRKLKDPAKFFKDKSIGGNLKRASFGKSLSELISKRVSPDFKRERFYEGRALKREKRFQRRLQRRLRAEKKALDSIQPDEVNDEDSHRKIQSFVDHRAQMTYPKRKTLESRRNENPTQVILKSNEIYRKVQPEKNDNPFVYNENGKNSNIDKRIEEKFASISNALKEDSIEKIIQATSISFQALTKNEDVSRHADEVGILKIHNGLEDDLRVGKKFNDPSIVIRDEATRDYSTELIGMQRLTMNDNLLATAEFTMTNNEVVTASSPITWRNNYRESTFHELEGRLSNTIIGPFLSLSVRRKSNVSRKANSTKRTSSIYQDVSIAKQTGFLMREFSSMAPHSGNANDYFEVTGGLVGTSSSSWTSFKQATMFSGELNNRSEQEGAKNARFLEFNNSSWMIAGNSARSRDPSIAPRLSLRSSDSLIELRASSRSEEGEQARYTEDSLAENLKDTLTSESSRKSLASQERDEIAKLVDRIVRQYAAFTPIMPGMPTFDEITEPETLPPEAETTVIQLINTTVPATTTRITDKAFRPPIRLLHTTPLSREMHEEASLDVITFAEETEGTTNQKVTTVKWRPPAERYKAKPTLPGKVQKQKSSNKAEKSEKAKKRINASNKNSSAAKTETWHHTTARQQLVASNGCPEKGEAEKRKHESKIKHVRDSASSAWPLSTIASSGATNEVAQTRSKRAGLIRGSSDHTPSIFCDYEGDKEDRRSGRTVANKSAGSPDMMEPNGLHTIEKRLAGELNYPASQGSSRRSRENEKRIQEHNAAPENIIMRDIGTVNERMDEQDTRGSLKNYTFLKLHCAKDDTSKLNENPPSVDYRKDIPASIDASSPDQQKDSSGSMYKKTEMDRGTEKDAEKLGEPVAADIVRKIALNLPKNARNGRADDLSNGPAKPREESATTRISLDIKSAGDQDKTRETDTVIYGAKLMTANDKDEMRDPGVATKNVDEMISSSSAAAKQLGHKDARKINENPADVHRVSSIAKGYLRRPRGNVHDIIRRMIGKLYREKSSSASIKNMVGSEEGVDRSVDWHRSGRKLLSSKDSNYVEKDDDEYYQDEESETNAKNNLASDNKAIARRNGLSSFGNQPGLHKDRDRRLAAESRQLLDENIEAAEMVMPQEKSIAVRDTAIIPDNVQAANEGTLSRLLMLDLSIMLEIVHMKSYVTFKCFLHNLIFI